MKRIFNIIAICTLFTGTVVSCNYLDVAEEVTAGLDDYSEVFENVGYTNRWYGEIFRQMPDYSSVNSATAGMGNPWSSYSDEVWSRYANNAGKYGNWNASKTEGQRWGVLYQMIRQANIFLENVHPITGEGTNASNLFEEDVNRMKANVRFMRAAYYYYLMELYGPIPIIENSLTLQDDLSIPRKTLDEVIDWIDTELLASMEGMEPLPYHATPAMQAVPTKGAVLAIRAKLWVYAASPLFNGGVREMWPGATLFPARDNGAKLDKAIECLEELIEFAEAGNYELYEDTTPALSVYNLFQMYNREIIWANSRTTYQAVPDVGGLEQNCTPKSEPGGSATLNVLQELVDDFYMADGLPTRETSFLPKSPDYSENGFGTWNGVNDVSNMYIGREPRFYNTVTFAGMKWHVSNREIWLYAGGNAGIGGGATDGNPYTGYFLYKRYNRTVHNSTGTGIVKSFPRPSIIFRLGEFHLLYAEMVNEKDPSDERVLRYLNSIRNRAGLPDIETLNPAIAGNQELQRQAIRRESRIELATEGQRYFDVRRWMIAGGRPGEGGQGGDFHGMNVNGDRTAFYARTSINPSRSFLPKNYLFPIPDAEIRKSGGKLIQNPGW